MNRQQMHKYLMSFPGVKKDTIKYSWRKLQDGTEDRVCVESDGKRYLITKDGKRVLINE